MSVLDFTPLDARIDPASAAARHKHFTQRIEIAEEQARQQELTGREAAPSPDPSLYYVRMLRAQRDFAWAQLKAACRSAGEGPGTDPQSRPEPHERGGEDAG